MEIQYSYLCVFLSGLLNSVLVEPILFNQQFICDQSYGNVIDSFHDVQSKISCTSLCAESDNCASQTYNPTSRECRLNTDKLDSPASSGCTPTVFYGQQLQQGDCLNGESCTLPFQNTRLCDGAGPGQCHKSQGRLEVYLNDQWGTVCDDYWNEAPPISYPNAIVVCGMYGYSSAVAEGPAYYGMGSGSVLLDTVQCSGTETSIFQCPSEPIGVTNCFHNEDVGVTCS